MKIRFTLALLLPALPGFAQTLTNDGAVLTVGTGALLYVAGVVQNNAVGVLTNAGTVQLTGDLTNTGTLNSSGTLLFAGSTPQTFMPGTAAVAALTQRNTGATGQNTLFIPADLTIGTSLVLTQGLVRTAPGATITLSDGAALSGEASGQYVQGNLRVVRAAGTGALDFGHGATLDCTGLGTVAITRTAGLLADNLSRAVGLGVSGQTGIDRIWTVEAVTPTAPVAVTLQWLPDDDNGIATTSFAQAQAWQAPVGSAAWGAASAGQAVTVMVSSRRFSFTTAALGRLTIGVSTAPLPVELVRFTAEPLGDDALLHWATASEKNNDHFDVEASADGKIFHRIGQVAGHGSTSQPQQYQFTDPAIARYAASPVYYRLRQVDANRTETYSPVRTVQVRRLAGFAAQLFPNPLREGEAPALRVRTADAGPVAWQLTDVLGRTVCSLTVDVPVGTSTLPLACPTLTTGVYLVRVQQGSQHVALKLVVE